jgi:hypothetical protein
LKLVDGLLEAFDVGLGVAVELVEEVREVLGLGEVVARLGFCAVLEEDGGGGVFEDRVGERVAEGDFLADFGVEFVGGVFGLRVAAVEVEVIAEGAIGADLAPADFGGELRNEVPVGFLASGGQQSLESGARGAFVGDLVVGVGGERFVVVFDFLVGGFEMVGEGHGAAHVGENLESVPMGDDNR